MKLFFKLKYHLRLEMCVSSWTIILINYMHGEIYHIAYPLKVNLEQGLFSCILTFFSVCKENTVSSGLLIISGS